MEKSETRNSIGRIKAALFLFESSDPEASSENKEHTLNHLNYIQFEVKKLIRKTKEIKPDFE